MSIADIEAAITDIEDCRWDDEAAHSKEERLHQAVLRAIAEGRCKDPARAAALALTTLDIDFNRWCA